MRSPRVLPVSVLSTLLLCNGVFPLLASAEQPDWSVTIETFPVGGRPLDMTCDGANVWISFSGSNQVLKLRASDGTNLGTFFAGYDPRILTFDGANIWVSNYSSNTVTKLRASDGVRLGTFGVGNRPVGMAYDGANIWVANTIDGTVTKLLASDGTVLGTFPLSGPGIGAVLFDGEDIWIAAGSGLDRVRPSDGKVIGMAGSPPGGNLTFDGRKLWFSTLSDSTVTAVRTRDGAIVGSFPTREQWGDVAFDGANIWKLNTAADSVTILRARNGAHVGAVAVVYPVAITYDGTSMWVGDAGKIVSKITLASQ